MRVSPIQNDFSGGEFSPMSAARSDHPRYKTGVAKSKNAVPLLQGPIQRRSGTRYIGNTDIVGARLVPFRYSNSQAYMLEFGNNYIKVYKNRGVVKVGPNPILIQTPYLITDVQNIKWAQSLDQLFVVCPGQPPMVLSRFSDTDWSFKQIVFSDGPYLNDGFIPQLCQITSTTAVPVLTMTGYNPATGAILVTTSWFLPKSNLINVQVVQVLAGSSGGAGRAYQITLASPAVFKNGDTVTISGVTGATTDCPDPNGTWQLGKVDDSNYILLGIADISSTTATFNYTGGGVAVGYSTAPAVTAVGNASGEIEITLNLPDVFGDGSTVYVTGLVGLPGATGTWVLKKLSPTSYILTGSVYAFGYVNGGDVFPALFVNTDVGRHIRFKTGDNQPWVWGIIDTVTSSIAATVRLQQTPSIFPPIIQFAMGAWSATTGYPTAIAFHQQRLWFAGPQLQTLYGSVLADFFNFAPSSHYNADGSLNTSGVITDSDAVTFTINSSDNHAIVWMTSDEYGMPIGTLGGVFVMKASSANEAITPTNVDIKRVDSVGCADVIPIYMGKSTIYLSLSTRKLFELTYYYNIDGYRKTDLTEIAANLTGKGITSNPAAIQLPQPILYMAREDGTILSCTFERSLDALRTAWSHHELGGQSDPNGTLPEVRSMASLPDPTGTFDDIWMTVIRYINGVSFQTVEVLEKNFEDFDNPENYYGVDCGATYDQPLTIEGATNAFPTVIEVTGHGLATGNDVFISDVSGFKDEQKVVRLAGKFPITVIDANHFSIPLDATNLSAAFPLFPTGNVRKIVSQVSGLTWLEGETVSLLGDGKYIGTSVVAAGVATLPTPAAVVQIGYTYGMEIQGLRIEGGSQDGTSMGKYRRINQLGVNLNRSYDFEIGVNFGDMVPVSVSKNSDDSYQGADPLFTGILNRIGVEANYDYANQWAFRVNTPTPFQLLAVYPQMETNDFG